MKASEVTLRDLPDKTVQYCVPLFQRPYSWEEKNWEQLWIDVESLYENGTESSHFMGAVVTLPISSAPERAAKFMLIDGQQRLTTIILILAILAHRAQQTKNDFLATKLQQSFLTNLTRDMDEDFKLRPTQGDRSAFETIMRTNFSDGDGRLHDAARYFAARVAATDAAGQPFDLDRLVNMLTGGLDLVSITLEKDDSPHRIFESLNNKGMPLSAADLVRNLVFMLLPPEHHQEAYSTLWRPLEEEPGDDLSGFFWRCLMMDGSLPRWDAIYETMRGRISGLQAEGTFSGFSRIRAFPRGTSQTVAQKPGEQFRPQGEGRSGQQGLSPCRLPGRGL